MEKFGISEQDKEVTSGAARTCPVCGTKYIVDHRTCPYCNWSPGMSDQYRDKTAQLISC